MRTERLQGSVFLLGGQMRVDVHGHGRIGMAQQLLCGFHIYACIIQHGGIGVPQLMRGERFHRNDLRIAPARVFAAS